MNDKDIDNMIREDELMRCSNNSLLRLSEYERARLYGVANQAKDVDEEKAAAQRDAAFAEEMRRMRKLDDETEENLAAEYAKIKHEVQLRKSIEQQKGVIEGEVETNDKESKKNTNVCQNPKSLSMLQEELSAIEVELKQRKTLYKSTAVIPVRRICSTVVHVNREKEHDQNEEHSLEEAWQQEEQRAMSDVNRSESSNDRILYKRHEESYEQILNAPLCAPYLTLYNDGDKTRYEAIHSRNPVHWSVQTSIKRSMLPKSARRSKHFPQPAMAITPNAVSSFTRLEKWERLGALATINSHVH